MAIYIYNIYNMKTEKTNKMKEKEKYIYKKCHNDDL